MVQAQLLLLPTENTWRIDPSTRRIGREGLAAARAALAAAGNTTALQTATAVTPDAAAADHEHTLAA